MKSARWKKVQGTELIQKTSREDTLRNGPTGQVLKEKQDILRQGSKHLAEGRACSKL